MRKKPLEPIFVPLQHAADVTGFSVFTLREKVASGELPGYRMSEKPGSAIRVRMSDVMALMKPVVPSTISASR